MSRRGMSSALSAEAPATSTAACPWCSEPLPERAQRLPGRVVCPACGVAITDPWPTDAELDRAYSTSYRPESGRFSGPGDALLRRTRGRLARRLDEIAPPGPVLDVGCGDGALLHALHAAAGGGAAGGSVRRRGAGRDATGLERESARADVRAAEIDEVEDGWAA